MAIPVAYTVLAGTLTSLVPEYFSDTMQMFGEGVPGPILAPTLFPIYFQTWLKFNSYFGLGGVLNTVWFRVLITFLPTFAIYSTVTYGILSIIGFPRKKALTGIDTPPPPPGTAS